MSPIIYTILVLALSSLLIGTGCSSRSTQTLPQYEPDHVKQLHIDSYPHKAIIGINIGKREHDPAQSAGITPSQRRSLSAHASHFPTIQTVRFKRTAPTLQALTTQATMTPSQSLLNPNTFYVYDFDSSGTVVRTLEFEQHYQGSTCLIYHVKAPGITVNTARIQQLGTYFDSTVYPTATTLFTTPTDVDGNQKIIVLLYPISIQNLLGYFWSDDLFSTSSYYTNGAEILYINSRLLLPAADFKTLKHTLIHEFQHLINLSSKIKTNSNTVFETWIEEGLAEGAVPYVTDEPLADHFTQLATNSTIRNGLGIFNWNSSGEDYTLAHTFLEYCRIQSNADSTFYRSIMENSSSTYTNVYAVMKSINPSLPFTSFNDIVTHFHLANLIQAPTGVYGYKNDYTFPTMIEPSITNPSLQAGGALYYLSPSYNFTPANIGSNIYYYKINH